MAVHDRCPEVGIEILCSDLDGNLDSLRTLLVGCRSVCSRTMWNVSLALTAMYETGGLHFHNHLEILAEAKKIRPDLKTKTSIMVGLGRD